MDRVGRTQQLQGRAHAGWRQVVGLDLSGAHHKHLVRLGRNVDRVARMDQPDRAAQCHIGRVQADHLAAHTPQASPLRPRAQATAVHQPVRLARLARLKITWCAVAVPVQRHTLCVKAMAQRIQQLPVVQLALARQQQTLVKAPGQAGLLHGQRRRIQR